MIPSPTNPTGSPKAATSRRLDPQSLTAPQATARLRRELLAVEQVASGRAGGAAAGARRAVPAALGEQRVLHRLEGLQLADDSVAAVVGSRAARPAPDGVARDQQRELELERL